MSSENLDQHIRRHVAAALAEDLGSGDVTAALLPATVMVEASIISREPAVLCGQDWLHEVYRQLDPNIAVIWQANDGERLAENDVVCKLEGLARTVLSGERTALNYLQCLSGTATLAARYAAAAAGTRCTILDTRKTLPGMRLAQKYAVRCGGAVNHRTGLYDGILIKENHIISAGSISAAIAAARALATEFPIEVEVENLHELDEALVAGADIVMLDNFTLADTRAAVEKTAGRAKLEASGNMSLDRVAEVAATGVDYISVGGLTKDVRAIDLSMRVEFSK